MSILLTDAEIKQKNARLCELCEQLWPNEWAGKYTGTREGFRDWLNEKTDLDVDHITDKAAALTAWLEKLEELAAEA
jgi:hypothetical protein